MHPKTLRRINELRQIGNQKWLYEMSKNNHDSALYWKGYLDALKEVELKPKCV